MKKIEFGTSEKVSGVYFFNEKFNKYQINIDCVNWMLVYESYRFDSLLEAQNFINSKYNVNYTFMLNNI